MCRVLIADDEPKVLLLIQSLIQWDELGLRLIGTAHDGVSALTLIKAQQPDILITDIRMPGHDGIELIARAKQLNPKIDCIIISGYRHFDYAQKAIRFGVEDYLLKPLKAAEINRTLRKMVEKYQARARAEQREVEYSAQAENEVKMRHERFMLSVLDGLYRAETPAAASLEALNASFGLSLRAGVFQAILVKADVHFASFNANVRKLLAEKCLSVTQAALAPHCHACVLYVGKQGVYALLNFAAEQGKALRKALLAVIDELQSQAELFENIKVTIGQGRAATDLSEMQSSFREAESAVANRLLFGAGKIIDKAAEFDVTACVSRVMTNEARKHILQGVEVLDAAKIDAIIKTLAQAIIRQEGVNGLAIAALCEECVHIVRFGLKSQNGVDAWIDAEEASTLEKFGLCASWQEMFERLAAHASGLLAHIAERKKNENGKPVREAQKYIHAHYALPINLESISQTAGFNPTYFSLLFKKETGMNFLEYLTEVRIKEAKRLLADPRKTIADVASEVGYSDSKHFSKLFTRSTGLQPSKYRKLYF